MIGAGAIASGAKRRVWPLLSRALQGLALVALCFLLIRVVLWAFEGGAGAFDSALSPWLLGGAALLYLAGHGFRILRLALLIGGWRVGFREIAAFHLMTAAASLTAPLKLGEIYRIIELTNIAGDGLRALVIAWWERVLDALAILCLIALALVSAATSQAHLHGVAVLTAAFLAATAVAFWVVPDNLRRLSVLIIRRYDAPATVPVLAIVDYLRRTIQAAPYLVHNKFASLATITILVWICELSAFVLAAPAAAGSFNAARDGFLSFLSAIAEGVTLLSVITSSEAAGLLSGFAVYLAVTQTPLVVLGFLAAPFYMRRPVRERFLQLGALNGPGGA